MTIIPPPPADVHRTKLFQALHKKSTAGDGLAEKAEQLIRTASPLLDLIASGPFSAFTLHNANHVKKIIHLLDYLISDETFENLSSIDCYFLISCCYLHDMGMCLTSTERARVLNSDEYSESIQLWQELHIAIQNTRARHNEASENEKPSLEQQLHELNEAALSQYLRPKHATRERYIELISMIARDSGRTDLFSVQGNSFESYLIDACVSHNLNVSVLAEVKDIYSDRFPRKLPIGGQHLNTQFSAAALRIADILDFDRERTPKILFESLGIAAKSTPGSDVTLQEWNKHLSVHQVEISPQEIIVSAECHHPVIERSIRDFCEIIEKELNETRAVLARNIEQIQIQYQLTLPPQVRANVNSIGYTFKDLSLKLNEGAIMTLLMGEKLYSHQGAALREMIQNSIDACEVRRLLGKDPYYEPKIKVSHRKHSGHDWIQVEDNGIGMDDHVLSEYFFKIGTTYYNSPEFRKFFPETAAKQFTPIGRFGIGILSTFMIGDQIEITTQNIHSHRNDTKCRYICIEKIGSLAFVTDAADRNGGTTVEVRLRSRPAHLQQRFLDTLLSHIEERITHPKHPIEICFEHTKKTLKHDEYFNIHPNAIETLDKLCLKLVILNLDRWSEEIRGSVACLFEILPNSKLRYSSIKFGNNGIHPGLVFTGYHGNRISINGFTMSLKKAARVFRNGRLMQLPIAFDIDLPGGKNIIYNISRDSIIGDGASYIKRILRESIVKGLKETGVFDQLNPETQALLELSHNHQDHVHDPTYSFRGLDSEIMTEVLRRLPSNFWPKGIHRKIADELKISPSVVSKAVTILLREGKVNNPNNPALNSDIPKPQDSSLQFKSTSA